MSELVVLNGASNIAKTVTKSLLKKSVWNSVKLVDARPFRQSVYSWQSNLGVNVNKQLARNAQNIKLSLEGANEVVYFTHDYYTMASDKNNHLKIVAKLAKQQGVKKLVAVCPFEHELYWNESEEEDILQRSLDAQAEALQSFPNMTILRPNLVFGGSTHFIHLLTQVALSGKSPNSVGRSKHWSFQYAPVHSDDVAAATADALEHSHKGNFSLNGPEHLNIGEIVNTLQAAARNEGNGISGAPLSFIRDAVNDFFVGTTAHKNAELMQCFYEANLDASQKHSSNPYPHVSAESKLSDFYKPDFDAEEFSVPTKSDYNSYHLN